MTNPLTTAEVEAIKRDLRDLLCNAEPDSCEEHMASVGVIARYVDKAIDTIDALQARIKRVEVLPEKWRREMESPVAPPAAIAYEACIGELTEAIKEHTDDQ